MTRREAPKDFGGRLWENLAIKKVRYRPVNFEIPV